MTQRAELWEHAMEFLRDTALVTEERGMTMLTSKGFDVLLELEKSAQDKSSADTGVSSSFYGSALFAGAIEQ